MALIPNGNTARRCLAPPSRHRMRSRSAATTAMGTGVYMPCYNLLWDLHVPYLFSLYLGVNRHPLNQRKTAAVGSSWADFVLKESLLLRVIGALPLPTLFHFLRSAAERYGNGLAMPTSIHCRYSCFRLGPNKSHVHGAFCKFRCSTNDAQIAFLMSALPQL